MLAKSHRLSRTDNIPKILRNGEPFQTSLFLAKSLPNKKKNARFSVIVSQKVSKGGVKRNTLRRRLYEAIRTNLNEHQDRSEAKVPNNNKRSRSEHLAISKPNNYYDTVILPAKRALDASYQSIEENIIKLLGNLNE